MPPEPVPGTERPPPARRINIHPADQWGYPKRVRNSPCPPSGIIDHAIPTGTAGLPTGHVCTSSPPRKYGTSEIPPAAIGTAPPQRRYRRLLPSRHMRSNFGLVPDIALELRRATRSRQRPRCRLPRAGPQPQPDHIAVSGQQDADCAYARSRPGGRSLSARRRSQGPHVTSGDLPSRDAERSGPVRLASSVSIPPLSAPDQPGGVLPVATEAVTGQATVGCL